MTSSLRLLQLVLIAALFNTMSPTALPAQGEKASPAIEIVPLTGTQYPDAVVFSPDGARLLTAGHELALWDASNGGLLHSLRPHRKGVESAAFSPDGTRVLTGSRYDSGATDTAKLWDATTWQLLQTLAGHLGAVKAVAFSPDGQLLLTGGSDKTAKLWDTSTGKLLRTFVGHTEEVKAAVFLPDGPHVLTGSRKSIRLWDIASGALTRTFTTEREGELMSLAISPDGLRVASSHSRQLLAVFCQRYYNPQHCSTTRSRLNSWNVQSGELISTLDGARDTESYVAFSPDGEHILFVESDLHEVKLLNATTSELVKTFKASGAEQSASRAVALSPDGARLVSAHKDAVNLWNIATGERVFDIRRRALPITSVAFSPDGTSVISGGFDSIAKLWTTSTGRLRFTWEEKTSLVEFSPDGRTVVTQSGYGFSPINFWDAESGQLQHTFKSDLEYIHSIAFSPDGTRVLIGGKSFSNKGARLHEVASGTVSHALEAGRSSTTVVDAVAFSPDGTRLLTAGWEQIAKLWDAVTGQLLRTFESRERRITSVAFSPDGTRILAGGDDNTAKLWEVESGALLWTSEAQSSEISSVAFTPDGVHLLVTSADAIALHDAATGKIVRIFSYQERGLPTPKGARRAAVSRDGRRIVAGAKDGALRLWNIESGELLATFIGATNGEWITYTPEGFFDGSKNGADLVLVYRDGGWIPMERAYNVLHRPDLVQEKLLGDADGKVKAAAVTVTFN